MAVISLLCSQVELRWNSTGSHCVPIFRTLKKICWVLKRWNEALGALTKRDLWGNTWWKHNGNNLVLQFPFCAPLNLESELPIYCSFFLTEPYCFTWVCLPLFYLHLRKTQKLMRWQSWLCQSLRDPQGLLPTFHQVLGMQIKFGMPAFRCDNYGFICKLSLPLMLRDIRISSNVAIREDHICWCSTDSKSKWFSWRQRSVNNHSFRQQCALEICAACSLAQDVCKKIFTFSHLLRYSNIKAFFLSKGNTKQTENRFLLPCYPMKQNVALFSGAMYSFYALIKLCVSIMGYRWINEY